MKLLVVVLVLAAVVAAEEEVGYEPITDNYHENYGIPEAANILASESAVDFDGFSRIAGGNRARTGQFRHMGGLVIRVPQGQSVCGSSLMTPTRLVTAAHCWWDGITQASQFTVVLGSTTLFTGGHRVNTNRVTMHPQWNHRTLANDIAVAIINAVPLGNNIATIGLASGGNLFVGSTATAAGFGRKGDNVNIASNQPLSYVSMPVITNADCRRTFNNVIDSNICTSGANGRSPCPGDSGGPLTVGSTLVGAVSFGARAGCTRGHPAVYARISSFNAWIRSV